MFTKQPPKTSRFAEDMKGNNWDSILGTSVNQGKIICDYLSIIWNYLSFEDYLKLFVDYLSKMFSIFVKIIEIVIFSPYHNVVFLTLSFSMLDFLVFNYFCKCPQNLKLNSHEFLITKPRNPHCLSASPTLFSSQINSIYLPLATLLRWLKWTV